MFEVQSFVLEQPHDRFANTLFEVGPEIQCSGVKSLLVDTMVQFVSIDICLV